MSITSVTTSSELNPKSVADQIRAHILEGKLRVGEALPSERRMSTQLGVGRTVLRKALAELDGEGLLERKGPRLRTVTYNRPTEQPGWLKKSVVLLTPPKMTGVSAQAETRTRWMQYTTLGTIDVLRENDIHAITLSEGGISEGELHNLAAGRPMGVLIPELSGRESDVVTLANIFKDANVPVVCYGGSPLLAGFDRVVSDHEGGSYGLTKALIARGCKRIVQFWPKPWNRYWFEARQRGYDRAMREAGLQPFPNFEFPYVPAPTNDRAKFEYAAKQVAGFMLELRQQANPDSLLLATDRDVPYAAAALRLHGLKPGKDVVLAGYDNYWKYCEELEFEATLPALSVDKSNTGVGRTMVRLLIDRVAGVLPEQGQTRVLPQQLIELSEPIPSTTSSGETGTF